MILKSNDYISLIEKEIKWCKENECENFVTTEKNETYQEGFIDGLKQAKTLISQLQILR